MRGTRKARIGKLRWLLVQWADGRIELSAWAHHPKVTAQTPVVAWRRATPLDIVWGVWRLCRRARALYPIWDYLRSGSERYVVPEAAMSWAEYDAAERGKR